MRRYGGAVTVVLVTGMSGTGKRDAEQERIRDDLANVTAEIDTRTPLDEVVDGLERIADGLRHRIERSYWVDSALTFTLA